MCASPLLFNLYNETIFQETLEGSRKGVIINVVVIHSFRFGDCTILVTNRMEDLKNLDLQRIWTKHESKTYDNLKIINTEIEEVDIHK